MHVNQVGTAEMFYGINGARMVASMHIVMGHLYQMTALPGASTSSRGASHGCLSFIQP